MGAKKRISKIGRLIGIGILGGIVGGGFAMFGWAWTFMGGYQLFFAEGDWGGAAFQYEQPLLCLWTAAGSAALGFLAGATAAILNFASIPVLAKLNPKKREGIAAGMFALAGLPIMPTFLFLGLGYLAIIGIIGLFVLGYKILHREQPKPKRISSSY